ncbi:MULTISPECIES: alkaline phosphatase [Pseudoalteromonas]|uniref:Alkaline phosphatase n=1 Tax=Pseudoalteromonas obscura TaxID=3048491 RepID=A0ABT7ENF7_9GAMM|nr:MULTISPECIES: alkaline phosphatase [Pseudoalteromonas]MBQ4835188.1 alkaline phosphatase [Pseudoalteromonas luteoviolacea]MDK2596584.1 alkaline phosphatase [Pseudoalteromonas sp. P94(2023)]
MSRKISAVAAAISLLASSQIYAAPKNIIYMIGDGMGPAYTTAYRYYKDDKTTKTVEPTVFDSILVGMAHTYPDDNTVVTDSAAGATALSTAIKSYNGAIAVDTKKKPLKTMLQMAKENGKTTALVATSQINHATPASFAAHNESRRNYDEIADDYVDVKVAGKLPVDLMLGGGTKYFIREDRNIVSEFKQAGYQYIDNLNKLNTIESIPAIGLFAEKGMPYAIDESPLRLTHMTKKALSLLNKDKNDKGFFVMIEGSQIDWCGHANDIACAMKEMEDFAQSIELAKAYVDNNPDTLLVITADHSTGGLTLGADGDYKWERDVVANVKNSVKTITKKLKDSKNIERDWVELTGLEYSEDIAKKLTEAKPNGDRAIFDVINGYINQASYTGWTTGGHTAIDVQVFAHGKGREHFIGSQNNTQIAEKLISFIE